MNRLVCTSTDVIDHGKLPQSRRDPGGPARVLFLHGMEVGFATTTENLIHFCGPRPDIDAVHVRLAMPAWLRAVCRQSPVPIAELDYRYLRHMLAWRWHLRSLIGARARLPIDRFDVVHITTQQRGLIIRDFRRAGRNPTGTRFAINLDATLRNWESMRGLHRFAPPIDRRVEGAILRSADMLACATRWVAASATQDYAVDPARIVIHKPCARVAPFIARRSSPPKAAGSRVRMIFVGGNWQDKGGPRLLAWHQKRWSTVAELHIVSGSAPVAVGRLPGVVLHGRVPHERLVSELLPAMDFFVVPTKWDTFMIAAQEAQAAGLPVVATRTGGLPECVQGGVTGFLCSRSSDEEFITSIERVLFDPVLRARMSVDALSHARGELSADVWHNHLLDQLIALADNRTLRESPIMSESPTHA